MLKYTVKIYVQEKLRIDPSESLILIQPRSFFNVQLHDILDPRLLAFSSRIVNLCSPYQIATKEGHNTVAGFGKYLRKHNPSTQNSRSKLLQCLPRLLSFIPTSLQKFRNDGHSPNI